MYERIFTSFKMFLPSTTSTLFPYTTLFRSARYRDVIEFKSDDHRLLTSHVLGDDGNWSQFMEAHYRRKEHRADEPEKESDRKSTRLNSSHLVISYAVFCLKKKKKTLILHEK